MFWCIDVISFYLFAKILKRKKTSPPPTPSFDNQSFQSHPSGAATGFQPEGEEGAQEKETKLKKKGAKLQKKSNKTQDKRYKTHTAPDSEGGGGTVALWPPLVSIRVF